jgi:hypothetical protein
MIDSLSGTLLRDERILSVPERELLANLLQRTRTQSNAPENIEAFTRTVGEFIAERALGVLGESMTRQLLDQQLTSRPNFPKPRMPLIRAGSTPGTPPVSPSGTPRPPGRSPPPISVGTPPSTPPPPPASSPRPPGTSPPPISFKTTTLQPKTGGIAVLDYYVSAECAVLDEFLTPSDLNTLRQ